MSDTPEPRLIQEDRDKSLRGFLRRIFYRYAMETALAIAVLLGGATWSLVTGMAQAPANYRALRAEVDTLKTAQETLKSDMKEVGEAAWTQVALQCLAMPRGDSTIILTRLNCGKAYRVSGLAEALRR